MKALHLISLTFLLFSSHLSAAFKSETLILNETRLHVTHWSDSKFDDDAPQDASSKETIILLSGPTDNWNSDSAWFARLAPKLAKKFKVISIDRAGQVFANRNSHLGYVRFGQHLMDALLELRLKRVKFISFASSNLSLLTLTQINNLRPESARIEISKIVMIDPDVLMPYSISRYSKDALPFKENLVAYKQYVREGKYDQRATEKNQAELKHLKELSKEDKDTSWSYVEKMFKKRLETANIINLFEEISIYDRDLKLVKSFTFPNHIPLVIFDTDFEQVYIQNAKTEEEKMGLVRWKEEAKEYYQILTKNSKKGEYIELATTEHLLPFSQPERVIQSL